LIIPLLFHWFKLIKFAKKNRLVLKYVY